MRSRALPALLALVSILPVAPGAARADDPCLAPEEMREVVAAKGVVAPLAAVRAARAAVPRAEVLRAALCPGDAGMVYLITLLDGGGHLVQVTVDAGSGKVRP